jgi:hypothetical protein
MSAYIVDKRHIVYLVAAALSSRISNPRLHSSFTYHCNGKRHGLSLGDFDAAADFANMLWRENIKSVAHRYPNESSATLPGPVDEDFNVRPNDFRREKFSTFEPAQVFKAIDCYEYQSCEHEGWEQSEAFAFCDALRQRTCCAVFGYEDAQWGAPDATSPVHANRQP